MRERKQASERDAQDLRAGSKADQLAGALSGGWKPAVALASCMLHTRTAAAR